MKVYEIGTFEQYEEGFRSFFKTLDKSKALFVYKKAKEYLDKLPKIEFNASDMEYENHIIICDELKKEFKKLTNVDLCLSGCNELYEIQMLDFDLN